MLNIPKSTDSTFSNQSKSGGTQIETGNPIGLLLALTYSSTIQGGITFTNQAKS